MKNHMRPALVSAAFVLVLGSAAVASATRTQLAGTGGPRHIGDFTCINDSIGRIDNNCGGLDAPTVEWIIPLITDGAASFTPSFVGAGDGDVYNTLNQTRCSAYWVSTSGVYSSYTSAYVSASYGLIPAPTTINTVYPTAGGAVGISCLIPPSGRVISVSYNP